MNVPSASDDGAAAPRPDNGTLLTMDRNLMAAQRTLMAWIRTSLSLISFGFTVAKFFDYLEGEQRPLRSFLARVVGPDGVGMALVALGVIALLFAIMDHRSALKRLHAAGLEKRRNPALILAIILCVLGVLAFLSLVL